MDFSTTILAHAQRSLLSRITVTVQGDLAEVPGSWGMISADGEWIAWEWRANDRSASTTIKARIVPVDQEQDELVEPIPAMDKIALELKPDPDMSWSSREIIELNSLGMVISDKQPEFPGLAL